jgi:isopentenyl-diphosphate delta-isomerase
VRPDPHEVAEWKYVDLQTLDEDILHYPHLYTPWFKKEWDRIQHHYLPEIRNL